MLVTILNMSGQEEDKAKMRLFESMDRKKESLGLYTTIATGLRTKIKMIR